LILVNDKIALFNIPALEIDTEVEGLLVVRGVTLSLSQLSITAHGVQIGMKLSDDIELSIHVDGVRVHIFRTLQLVMSTPI
jgi:hypothetical protein